MMRSLFSGVSGLKVHQTKMDVIGNNISNVNTVGFKGSSVNFSDIFYQTSQNATGPNDATGTAGRNAMQIGLGANMSSITANITGTGGSQRTDNPFDVMINGDSFFIVNNGGTNYFTKAGAFNVDAGGTLCTSSGAYVMGWQVNADGDAILRDSVSPLKVMSAENRYSPPQATTDTHIIGNIDAKDEQINSPEGKPVSTSFYNSIGEKFSVKMIVKQAYTTAVPPVAIPNEYTISVADVVDSNDKSIFVKENADGTFSPTGLTGFTFGGVNYVLPQDATGVDPTTGKITFTAPTNEVKMQFNSKTGKFEGMGNVAAGTDLPATAVDKSISIGAFAPVGTAGAPQPLTDAFGTVNIDFSSITKYGTSGQATLEGKWGDLDGKGAGRKVGNMNGISIDGTGKIYGSYDNGDKKLLGQIAVADFANPSGLESVGNNMFAATQNSGDFDGIGKDPTEGGGSLSTGVLEMSNVDLSVEFTTMITTQRGFQANSKIITTSDTLLEELINLKR